MYVILNVYQNVMSLGQNWIQKKQRGDKYLSPKQINFGKTFFIEQSVH